ncbi:MAG: hypothetical protein ACI4DO_05620 [Roseburia sp.]
MQNQKEVLDKNEIRKLSNELTYQRYLMNKGKIQDLFQKMTLQEYIALNTIASESECSKDCQGRTYLKDLSDKMQLTIRQTSKMIEKLKDRGLVLWSYDGNGSEGTYVTITEMGERLFQEQEIILRDCYGNVMIKFGKNNMTLLLKMMKEFDTLVCNEIKEMKEADSHGRDDEVDK